MMRAQIAQLTAGRKENGPGLATDINKKLLAVGSSPFLAHAQRSRNKT